MIIDTSALIAILRAEEDASDMAHAIERARDRRISAANYLEAAVVIDGSRDPVASRNVTEPKLIFTPVSLKLRAPPDSGPHRCIYVCCSGAGPRRPQKICAP